MYANNPFAGRRFFGRLGTVGALCAALGAPAAAMAPPKAAAKPPAKAPAKMASTTAAMPPPPNAQEQNKVNVTDYGVVDLAVQDTELGKVLEMLAIHSQKNIIVSKNVSATVTAYLYDVTFNEALDAILRPNGYGYIEQGNFIYIYTLDELAEIEKTNRKTESRIYELDHLSADDAKEAITPALSSDGKAAFRGAVAKGFEPKIADGGADEYAFNTKIVVNDYPENLDHIAALLNELDTPPSQVLVESTILQTTMDEKNAFGVDFSVIGNVNFTDLTSPLAAVANLLNGNDATSGFQPPDNKAQAVTSNVGNTAGAGGLKIGVVSDDISVFLRVLDEVTDTTVLARPKIMALNRQRAQVLVGAKVGYLSTTATETTTTQSVEFLDTGIKLVFRPFISKDGTIRMELAPSVSEASLRTVTDSNGLQVTIPDQLTNELTTNVRIRDGQTLVLGGLYKESTRINRRQIPILGDIPVLGTPFRGQDDTIRKDEIIFLITPTVVRDEVLAKAGVDAMNYAESARVGMRIGLLPWSRELVTNNHNQHAIEAQARGDDRLALWHTNTSLRLNPTQPEMIRFREQLTGSAERAHERSVLDRAWHPDFNHSKVRADVRPTTTQSEARAQGADHFARHGEQTAASTDPYQPISDQHADSSPASASEARLAATNAQLATAPGTPGTPGDPGDQTFVAVVEVVDRTTSIPPAIGDSMPLANAPASVVGDPLSDAGSDHWQLTSDNFSSLQALALDQIMQRMFIPWRLARGLPPEHPTAIDASCTQPTGSTPSELAAVLTEAEPK